MFAPGVLCAAAAFLTTATARAAPVGLPTAGRIQSQHSSANSEGYGEKSERAASGGAQARCRKASQAINGTERICRQEQPKYSFARCNQEGGRNRKTGAQRENKNARQQLGMHLCGSLCVFNDYFLDCCN